MAFNPTSDLKLDRALRKELSGRFGEVMSTEELKLKVSRKEKIYAIGDATVATLLSLGYMPKIAIFDYRTGRKKAIFPQIRKAYPRPLRSINRTGTLSVKLWNTVREASSSRLAAGIKVDGEEDLASLACIHFAKKGSLVIYGLRNVGMAVIRVDSKMKAYVDDVLKRMESNS